MSLPDTTKVPVNLDYFSVSIPSSEQGSKRPQESLEEHPSSLNSSSSSSSPSCPPHRSLSHSDFWKTPSSDKLSASECEAHDNFVHFPSPPLTPSDHQISSTSQSEGTSAPYTDDPLFPISFNVEDWISWDFDDANDANWSLNPFSPAEARSGRMEGVTTWLPETSSISSLRRAVPANAQYAVPDVHTENQDSNVNEVQELVPEGLYSTPLSWTSPTPGSNRLSITSTSSMTDSDRAGCLTQPSLSRSEEQRLRAIAMPYLIQPRYDTSAYTLSEASDLSNPINAVSPRKRTSGDTHVMVLPTKQTVDQKNGVDKRRNTKKQSQPPKKKAHNMIEKRYRTNLNDKILALRNSVPSLRIAAKRLENEETELLEDENYDGSETVHKLNKATILTQAVEYIAHLEGKARSLKAENGTMKKRIDAFEILLEQSS